MPPVKPRFPTSLPFTCRHPKQPLQHLRLVPRSSTLPPSTISIPSRSLRRPFHHLSQRPTRQTITCYSTTTPSPSSEPEPEPPTPKIYNPSTLPQPSPHRLIIDVREPAELATTGRIPGALSMPLTSNPDAFSLSDEDFYERFGFEKPTPSSRRRQMAGDQENRSEGGEGEGEGKGKDDGESGDGEKGVEEVIFYCKAGVRSRAAARLAKGWEGVKVGDFRGGWVEWEKSGGPRERD